jgi:hypothetical protein
MRRAHGDVRLGFFWALGLDLEASERETGGVENRHTVVFRHPGLPDGREERTQLGKTLCEEAGSPIFRACLRQWPNFAELARAHEAYAEVLPFARGNPIQQFLHPFAAPRSRRIPILQYKDVRPESADKLLDHSCRFRVICPSGGLHPKIDEAIWAFQDRKTHSSAEGIDGQNSGNGILSHGQARRAGVGFDSTM